MDQVNRDALKRIERNVELYYAEDGAYTVGDLINIQDIKYLINEVKKTRGNAPVFAERESTGVKMFDLIREYDAVGDPTVTKDKLIHTRVNAEGEHITVIQTAHNIKIIKYDEEDDDNVWEESL